MLLHQYFNRLIKKENCKMIGSMYYSWQFGNLIKWMRYSGKQWNIMAMTIVLQVQCHLLVQHEEVHVNAIIWVSAALDLVERWPLARVSHVIASWLWMALMKLLWVRGGYPHPPTHKPARYAGHRQLDTHWGVSWYRGGCTFTGGITTSSCSAQLCPYKCLYTQNHCLCALRNPMPGFILP